MENNGAHKKQYISTRVEGQVYDEIKQYLDANGLSMSDFMRLSIEHMLSEPNADRKHTLSDENTNGAAIEALIEQLSVKDEQLNSALQSVDQSQQLLAVQMDTSRLMLTDVRKRPRSRLKRVFSWT